MKPVRNFGRIVAFAVVSAGLILSFQNCARTGFSNMTDQGSQGNNPDPALAFNIEAPLSLVVNQAGRFRISAQEPLNSVTWTHPQLGVFRSDAVDGRQDFSFSAAGEYQMFVEVTRGNWTSGKVGFRVSVLARQGDVCAPLTQENSASMVGIVGASSLFSAANVVAQSVYSIQSNVIRSSINPSIVCHEMIGVRWGVDQDPNSLNVSGSPRVLDIGIPRQGEYLLRAIASFRSQNANGTAGSNVVQISKSMNVQVTQGVPPTCTDTDMNLRLSGPAQVQANSAGSFVLNLDCLPKPLRSNNGVEFKLNSGSFVGQNSFLYQHTPAVIASGQTISARLSYMDGSFSAEKTLTFEVTSPSIDCTTGPYFEISGPSELLFYFRGTEAAGRYFIRELKPSCRTLAIPVSWAADGIANMSTTATADFVFSLPVDAAAQTRSASVTASLRDSSGQQHSLALPVQLSRSANVPPNCSLSLSANPATGVFGQPVQFTATLSQECAVAKYSLIYLSIVDKNEARNSNAYPLHFTAGSSTVSFDTTLSRLSSYRIEASAGADFLPGSQWPDCAEDSILPACVGVNVSTLSKAIDPYEVQATAPAACKDITGLGLSPDITVPQIVGSSVLYQARIYPEQSEICHVNNKLIETEWLLDGKLVYLRDGATDGLARSLIIPENTKDHVLTIRVWTHRASCLNTANSIVPDGSPNGVDYNNKMTCEVMDNSSVLIERDFIFKKGINTTLNCTAQITPPTGAVQVGVPATFTVSYSGTKCEAYNRLYTTVEGKTEQIGAAPVSQFTHTFQSAGNQTIFAEYFLDLCEGVSSKASGPVCTAAILLGPTATLNIPVVARTGTWVSSNCNEICSADIVIGDPIRNFYCVYSGTAPAPTGATALDICGDPPEGEIFCTQQIRCNDR